MMVLACRPTNIYIIYQDVKGFIWIGNSNGLQRFDGSKFAYSMQRLRIKRILAEEEIRNRVARDLHDDMGSTLSTINILSAMAKAKLSSDVVKTASFISKISDNSQRMMEATDDIVWAIKPANSYKSIRWPPKKSPSLKAIDGGCRYTFVLTDIAGCCN